jgi:hypothetical protein
MGLSVHHTSKFPRTIRKPVLRGIWTLPIGLALNTTIVNGSFSVPSARRTGSSGRDMSSCSCSCCSEGDMIVSSRRIRFVVSSTTSSHILTRSAVLAAPAMCSTRGPVIRGASFSSKIMSVSDGASCFASALERVVEYWRILSIVSRS